jgi:hypothetical protein
MAILVGFGARIVTQETWNVKGEKFFREDEKLVPGI